MNNWSLNFSKSILERMGLEKSEDNELNKAKITGIKKRSSSEWTEQSADSKKPSSIDFDAYGAMATRADKYSLNKKTGNVDIHKIDSGKAKKEKKTIPANAKYEKELKNASLSFDLHKSLDAILEKGRTANWQKPEGVKSSDDEEFEPTSLSGDPGSRQHERSRIAGIRGRGEHDNLKRLAASSDPEDRKYAKKHGYEA